MPYATPASLPEADLRPGAPPILHTDTPDDTPAWAAEHRQAPRTSPNTARSSSAAWARARPTTTCSSR
jgi:hypothetical protein